MSFLVTKKTNGQIRAQVSENLNDLELVTHRRFALNFWNILQTKLIKRGLIEFFLQDIYKSKNVNFSRKYYFHMPQSGFKVKNAKNECLNQFFYSF